jgi:hypothetical protein
VVGGPRISVPIGIHSIGVCSSGSSPPLGLIVLVKIVPTILGNMSFLFTYLADGALAAVALVVSTMAAAVVGVATPIIVAGASSNVAAATTTSMSEASTATHGSIGI